MKNQRGTWIVVAVLLSIVVVWNLTRTQAEASAQSGAPRSIPGAVAPFWWTHLGTQSTASVWIGPPIERMNGETQRLWTLVCTQPGSEEPLACLQGVVPLDDDSPIGFKSAVSSFSLQPIEGWTWAQVDSKESLRVELQGFY